jgi:predicted metal-dependent phosphoesterase TrpH
MKVDLHLHSHHSDGVLSPTELMQLAAARGVEWAALTDHDTTQGCAEAALTCEHLGMRYTTGVEVTLSWRGQELHLIGLALDCAHAELAAHLSEIRRLRRQRLLEIGQRLQRKSGLPAEAMCRTLCDDPLLHSPTRLHLARALVTAGHATDVADAFKRWLGRGQPGYAPIEWPGLEPTLRALQAAGAVTVLAHPHRYKLSAGALRALLSEYCALGGSAMEVSIGGMSPNDLDRLATLARRFGLLASTGSDFHDPQTPWNPPGRFAKLPADLEHVAARL